MELDFQITKKDCTDFNKLYCKQALKKRLRLVLVIIIFAGAILGSEPFHLMKFLIGTAVSIIVVFGFFYFIPLYRFNLALNKIITSEQPDFGNRKLTIVDEGLLIESENKTTTWLWESIISVQSNELFVYLFLVDKRYLLFPKRSFLSENDATNFIGVLQNKIIAANGITNFPFNRIIKKPHYRIGLFCLIPVAGAVAGIIFIVDGISKYKDKWFIIMGFAGIVYNISIAFILFSTLNLGNAFRAQFVGAAQVQLNGLMKDVEFYKIKNGVYPDSLVQVSQDDPNAMIDDPLQSDGNSKNSTKYNYQRVGTHYYLFSSGMDNIPDTRDDIYPQVAKSDSAKFGLIRKSN